MICLTCKGNFHEDNNISSMVELNNRYLIIKNVPAQVCKQCGEASYNHKTAKRIEELVNEMKTTAGEIVGADFINGEIVTAGFNWSKKNDMIAKFVVSMDELKDITENKALHPATG